MKRICVPLMILTILLISQASVIATDFGREWLNLSKGTQVWYVAGFIEGYFYGHLDSKPWLSLPPPSEKKPKEVSKDKVIHILSLEYGVIADTMTRFYRDPANHGIEHGVICNIALNKLVGGTMERVQRELEEARHTLKSSPESDQ